MAFDRNRSNGNTNNAQAQGNDDNWKAQGFINLYLPGSEGKDRKIGAIPLKVSKAAEKQLLDYLNADPANVDKLAAKIKLTFQSAEVPSDKAIFALD